MGAIQSIFAKSTISISDLRKNISSIIQDAGDAPVAVLNHNKPAAYILSAKAYEALLERLDDANLTELAKKRMNGKRVKVNLSDLWVGIQFQRITRVAQTWFNNIITIQKNTKQKTSSPSQSIL